MVESDRFRGHIRVVAVDVAPEGEATDGPQQFRWQHFKFQRSTVKSDEVQRPGLPPYASCSLSETPIVIIVVTMSPRRITYVASEKLAKVRLSSLF